jgi:hypothetical protein
LTVSLTNNFFTHARAITFEDTASVTWAFNASTNQLSATATGGGGGSGANPTAKVGTSVVNGSASTFMRSDAAPPIDLAITPTWTGAHTFTPSSGIAITITAASGQQGISLAGDGTTYPFLCDGVGNSEAARFNSTNANGGFIDVSRGGTAKHWWGDAKALVSGTLDDTALRSTGKIVIAPGNAITTTFYNAGGIVVGSATGGNKGAGTLNATGLYVNGVAVAAGSTLTTIVQTGGASQNYTIPASNMHLIIAIGGGGGGQAGGAGAAGGARIGGGGGGGGGIMWALVPTAAIIGAVTLTVSFSNAATGGAGGVGGTATTGASGTSGSSVSVLGVLAAYGGVGAAANNGGSGGAGMWVPGTSGGTGGNGAQGAAGQDSNPTNFTGTAVNFSCLGGGGGGGVSAGNASFNGGRGGEGNANANPGSLWTQNGVGAAGTTAGGNAIQPSSPLGSTVGGAGGGGGGGASTAGGTGGNGAAGSDYGGGGGGGGATTTGSGSPVSGSGGRGGYAAAIFLAW